MKRDDQCLLNTRTTFPTNLPLLNLARNMLTQNFKPKFAELSQVRAYTRNSSRTTHEDAVSPLASLDIGLQPKALWYLGSLTGIFSSNFSLVRDFYQLHALHVHVLNTGNSTLLRYLV